MNTLYEVKLDIPKEVFAPDPWDDSIGQRLPSHHVISYNLDGTPASHRGDLRWDWSAYCLPKRKFYLYFDFWAIGRKRTKVFGEITAKQRILVDDIQHIMTIIIYKKKGPLSSFGTLSMNLGCIKRIALYCQHNSLNRLHDILANPKRLELYVSNLTKNECMDLKYTISTLMAIDPNSIGFTIAYDNVFSKLKWSVKEVKSLSKQTPPIPTRIFSAVLFALAQELDDFEVVSDRYLMLIKEFIANKRAYKPPSRRKPFKVNSIASSLIEKFDLENYFEMKSLSKTLDGIICGLREVQKTCKFIIHAYSGMRNNEAFTLPFNCYESEINHGRIIHIILGYTTKLNNGRILQTKWVTSQEGQRAIFIAQRIASTIYDTIDVIPEKTANLTKYFPLFVNTSYIKTTNYHQSGTLKQFMLSRFNPCRINKGLMMRIEPIIEKADITELEAIDPHRAWRCEAMFKAGKHWRLNTHQLRRSLALYAQKSGLVSLPSLRRQLQHITKEMSLYYSKGSFFAHNIIEDDVEKDKAHFCIEWRDTKSESEACAYMRDVLFCDEQLYGGAGNYEQKKKDSGIVVNRDRIIIEFRKGQRSYKETPLGGCINLDDCNEVGLKLLETDCVKEGCKNLIVKMSKLNRIIEAQANIVASLDQNSVTYRMEKNDLDVLINARNEWLKTKERREHDKLTR